MTCDDGTSKPATDCIVNNDCAFYMDFLSTMLGSNGYTPTRKGLLKMIVSVLAAKVDF